MKPTHTPLPTLTIADAAPTPSVRRRGAFGVAMTLACLASVGSAEAATYSVVRQLNMPSGSLRSCDGGLSTRTFVNDNDEVATVCEFNSVGISFDGLFGTGGVPTPYGSAVRKAVYWRPSSATPTVAGQPGLGTSTLFDLVGLSNQGQMLVNRNAATGRTTALWTSAGAWKTLKFAGTGLSGKSITTAGDVLAAGYEKGVQIVQSWTAGKLTTLKTPEGLQAILGWAPQGPLVLMGMGPVDGNLPAPLSLWTPAGVSALPNWGSMVPVTVEALNTRGQYMLRMGEPMVNAYGLQTLGPYQLVFFDGSRHVAVDGLMASNGVRSLNEAGSALIINADATGVLPPRDMVWSLAGAQDLRTSARLPAGFSYGRALAMNNLGHVVIEASQASGKKTWFVLKPD